MSQLAQLIQAQTQINNNQSSQPPTQLYTAASIRVEHVSQIDYNPQGDTGNNQILNKHSWIVDTGASCHIANSNNYFTDLRPIENWHVLFPNDIRLKATHIGNIFFNDKFTLTYALFVLIYALFGPSFKYNLLHVTRLSTSSNCELVFSSKNCIIQDTITKKRIGSAGAFDGLYHLIFPLFDISKTHCNASPVFSTTCCKEDVWHYRLGHLSKDRLAVIRK